MSGIEAGSLRHRIVIQKPTKETQYSGSVKATGWESIHRRQLPADYTPVSGGEVVRGVTIASTTVALFEIRYLAALFENQPDDSTEYRIQWMTGHSNPNQAPIFYIVRAHDPDGLRRTTLLEVRKAS